MTSHVVALVSPDGNIEAWLTAAGFLTPSANNAARYASRVEAGASRHERMRHEHGASGRYGRHWVVLPAPDMSFTDGVA